MADLIQWARTAQRTGLLRLNDESGGREVHVYFRDGRIVFSSSNERRSGWASYLKYLGFCTEDDVEAAFRVKESTGASVASILLQEKKLTHEQAVSTLGEKTIEDLCDVFLWPEGTFQFDPKLPVIKTTVIVDLDPIHIVCEGIRRAEVWSRMSAFIHPKNFFERSDDPLDETGTWEDLRVARHVWVLLDGNRNMDDVVEGLPFSRYKVYRAVSELLERKVAMPTEVTAVVDREKKLREKIEVARKAAADEKWTEAMEILQGLATAHPGRADIVEELITMTRGFERSIYEHNFTKLDVPVVTIGPESLARLNLYPTEGFLLSRIDGRLSVREILRITPVPEFEGLRAFKRLLSAKIIDFPHRQSPSATATEASKQRG
ncbi:MAG: DUF4388 domain-containing protein [Thermoanaerobaculia bacterium]|nr:DUF4388 domain-containing protein [Thermoanaerobaculia bacterium]